MFELENYIEYTKLLNSQIEEKFDVIIELNSSNCIILYNKYCKIEFTTGRYYLDFQFFLTTTNGRIEKKYSVFEIFDKEGITIKDVLTDYQKKEVKLMENEIEMYIYVYSIIINERLVKYFMDNIVSDL